MRPIRLEMEGFTCFRRKVEIDFSDLDLFAVTGPTGAGKTSLIDAMIYALYGRTPRLSKASELISQGALKMSVLFEFSSQGRRYRIVRSLRRTASGHTSKPRLERQGKDGEWQDLAGSSKQVREAVQRLLGLDYDAFTKSVVLPQGKFDQFLNGGPSERRRILSDLLKLDVYTRMGQRSREIAKQAQSDMETKREMLQGDTFKDVTPSHRKALKSRIRGRAKERKGLDATLADLKSLQPAGQELRELERRREQADRDLSSQRQSLSQAEADRQARESEVEQRRKDLENLQKEIGLGEYDEALHLELTRLLPLSERRRILLKERKLRRQRWERLSAQAQLLNQSATEAHRSEKEAVAALSRSEKELVRAAAGLRTSVEAHGSIESLRLLADRCQERMELQARLQKSKGELAGLESRLKDGTEALKKALAELDQAEAEAGRLEEEWRDLERRHLAEGLRRNLKAGQPCPVCSQEVEAVPQAAGEHRPLRKAEERFRKARGIADRASSDRQDLEGQLKALPQRVQERRKQVEEVRERVARIDHDIEKALGRRPSSAPADELKSLVRDQKVLNQAAQDAAQKREKARTALEKASRAALDAVHQQELNQKEVEAIKGRLMADDEEFEELGRQLEKWPQDNELQKRHAELEAARERGDRLAQEAREFEKALLEARNQVSLQEERIRERQDRAKEIEERSKALSVEWEASRSRFRKRLEKVSAPLPLFGRGADQADGSASELEAASGEVDEVERLQSEIEEVRRRREELGVEQARDERSLEQLEHLLEQARLLGGEVEDLKKRSATARELGRALQTDQFIAFIQEEAAQRLADYGTTHLRKLSSDRYSFDAEEDGFAIIDHWNADEPRSAVTLSGGESFLASLALALALADGLAEFGEGERARLDSLFLDEGFATLDAETLDAVVQSVETLAGGDRLIGVVSHLPELAERFPVRVRVHKSIAGSSLEVE